MVRHGAALGARPAVWLCVALGGEADNRRRPALGARPAVWLCARGRSPRQVTGCDTGCRGAKKHRAASRRRAAGRPCAPSGSNTL